MQILELNFYAKQTETKYYIGTKCIQILIVVKLGSCLARGTLAFLETRVENHCSQSTYADYVFVQFTFTTFQTKMKKNWIGENSFISQQKEALKS